MTKTFGKKAMVLGIMATVFVFFGLAGVGSSRAQDQKPAVQTDSTRNVSHVKGSAECIEAQKSGQCQGHKSEACACSKECKSRTSDCAKACLCGHAKGSEECKAAHKDGKCTGHEAGMCADSKACPGHSSCCVKAQGQSDNKASATCKKEGQSGKCDPDKCGEEKK